jgi:nucleoside-diphosphate-sugar epimerase
MIMQGVGVLILVTGGAGIIGSRLSRFLAGETDDLVVNVDS